jgi:3-deoxy-D-manno-octulosonic-acid transferase
MQVDDEQALASLLIRWLSDASERSRVGEHGRQVVAENRGALAALMDEMGTLLDGEPAALRIG